ncbi:hypothetical protein CRG98_030727 [Punica granatum]|uniref:ATP synthase subunit O, mitochondrial-like n=1 Tax=Punica granatum TaxID=22663 RepID=A0A2I0IXZ2_PUNGR|nr:hypothetical protein CRG98_030727 [Punica granatum]
MAGRIRSRLPLLKRFIATADPLSAQRSTIVQQSLLCPAFSASECSRNYATSSSTSKAENVKVPLALFGGTGNYASALYLSAVKANALDKVESELLDLVEASKRIVLAENGRLRNIESITKRFIELTMAHKGEANVTVTSVIHLPPEEEKELRETLQDIIGKGKKVKIQQKIDPSILGGLVVEFSQKVFDMSIKTRAKQMERFLLEPITDIF